MKKALKSVATTCDGDGSGESHVIFTKHGGTIVKVGEVAGSYSVDKAGRIKGAGELTHFDRIGNTYGMEAWVHVGDRDSKAEVFSLPVVAP